MGIWKYFLLTIVVELPVIVIWLRTEWKFALLIGLLLNLFTWTLLVTVYGLTGWYVLVLEFAVVIAEGCGYRIFFNRKWISCMLIAFVVNGLSYGAGLIFFN